MSLFSAPNPTDCIRSKKTASLSCRLFNATRIRAFGEFRTSWLKTETSAGELSALYVQSEIRIRSTLVLHRPGGNSSSQSRFWYCILEFGASLAVDILRVMTASTSGRSVSRTEHCGSNWAKAMPTMPQPEPNSITLRALFWFLRVTCSFGVTVRLPETAW